MNIGFLGFGEAAYNIALGLRNEERLHFQAYDNMADHPLLGAKIHARAEEAVVRLAATQREMIGWADIILAAVPSSFAVSVCEETKEFLRAGQIYADVSSSTPEAKKKIWNMLEGKGILFVDAAMLGPLPKEKHRVPIVASGNGATAFATQMNPFGMNIDVVGDTPGMASAIKLVRSIYMKGIASLIIETLLAADAYDVTDKVVNSISKTMDNTAFVDHVERLVTGTAIHCHRRGVEVGGSIQMMEEANVPCKMSLATKEQLESLEKYDFPTRYIDRRPTNAQEIINILREKL